MAHQLLFSHHRLVHVNYSSFIRLFLNYLSQEVFYNRIQTTIVGNYSKALQYIKDYKSKNLNQPVLPLLSGTFTLQQFDQFANRHWQHPTRNMMYFGSLLYEPLFKDDNVEIIPVFNRIIGNTDVILIAHSSPELHDYQMSLLNWFDLEKHFILPTFETQLHIPDAIQGFTYENEPKQITYQLDWSNTSLSTYLVESQGQCYLSMPVKITPMVRLISLSDGSAWYGSSELPEFRLTASFEWEFNVPTYIVLHTDYELREIKTSFMLNGVIDTHYKEFDGDFERYRDNPDAATIKLGDVIISDGSITHTYAFHHEITIPEDYDPVPDGGIEITLPISIQPTQVIKVVSYWGVLDPDREYRIKDSSTIILNVPFYKDDTITVYYYDRV